MEQQTTTDNVVDHGTNLGGGPSSSVAAALGNSQHSSSMLSLSNNSTATQPTNNLHHSTAQDTNSSSNNQRAAVCWRRMEDTDGADFSTHAGEKRSCRVVDAILEGDGRTSKRRKLTVLGESKADSDKSGNGRTNKQQRNKPLYRVLDPVTRLVDDSLTMVQAGDKTVAQHYAFVTTDPRLATKSRALLAYKNRGGNLLHACAQWNDVELTHDLLRQNLPLFAEGIDEDGRTPYETAELCGHTNVMEVLEAFGADTTNYVYDMFVPEDFAPMTDQENTHSKNIDEDDDTNWNPLDKTPISNGNGNPSAAAVVPPPNLTAAQHAHDLALIDTSRLLELQGGVGYWTEDGDLVLEVEPHHMMGLTSEYDEQDNSDVAEDDIDSNCEDYGGNDYPDDDSWEEEFLHEEQYVEDEDEAPGADEYQLW